jgi:hypothetical protein
MSSKWILRFGGCSFKVLVLLHTEFHSIAVTEKRGLKSTELLFQECKKVWLLPDDAISGVYTQKTERGAGQGPQDDTERLGTYFQIILTLQILQEDDV